MLYHLVIWSPQYLALQSTIDEVSIEDLSFSDNQGTPLIIKQPKEDYHLEEKFVSQTTRVCSEELVDLHNVHVMIKTNTEVNVIFEYNNAVYGGALYLNKTTISDTRCKLKAKFIDNTATTRGNSVYFASTPRGVIPNCSLFY